MIRIVDTSRQIEPLFDSGAFQYRKWETYIDSIYAGSAHMFQDEMEACIQSGEYTFEKDFLPVINAVYRHPHLEELRRNFAAVTHGLEDRIAKSFGKELQVDIVLYLGLCNGAGWVTNINGNDVVLLGIEKILELGWYTVDAMTGLIYHELGHVYQAQHGVLEQRSEDNGRNFVWQLFTEGIAMYFEQALVGDPQYYHQDKDGWAAWCGGHFTQILADFDRDLPAMTAYGQRYFGDWCDYQGHGDVGYYLGSRFVQELAADRPFDELIGLSIDAAYDLYQDFVGRHSLCES